MAIALAPWLYRAPASENPIPIAKWRPHTNGSEKFQPEIRG